MAVTFGIACVTVASPTVYNGTDGTWKTGRAPVVQTTGQLWPRPQRP